MASFLKPSRYVWDKWSSANFKGTRLIKIVFFPANCKSRRNSWSDFLGICLSLAQRKSFLSAARSATTSTEDQSKEGSPIDLWLYVTAAITGRRYPIPPADVRNPFWSIMRGPLSGWGTWNGRDMFFHCGGDPTGLCLSKLIYSSWNSYPERGLLACPLLCQPSCMILWIRSSLFPDLRACLQSHLQVSRWQWSSQARVPRMRFSRVGENDRICRHTNFRRLFGTVLKSQKRSESDDTRVRWKMLARTVSLPCTTGTMMLPWSVH